MTRPYEHLTTDALRELVEQMQERVRSRGFGTAWVNGLVDHLNEAKDELERRCRREARKP